MRNSEIGARSVQIYNAKNWTHNFHYTFYTESPQLKLYIRKVLRSNPATGYPDLFFPITSA